MDSFKNALKLQNSHYVFFVPRIIFNASFFEDNQFLKKITKLSVIAISEGNKAVVYIRNRIKNEKMVPRVKWDGEKFSGKIFNPDIISTLHGKKLRGSSFDHKPYTYISYKDKDKIVYDGAEVDPLDIFI